MGFVSYLHNLKKTLHLYVVLYLLGLSHVPFPFICVFVAA